MSVMHSEFMPGSADLPMILRAKGLARGVIRMSEMESEADALRLSIIADRQRDEETPVDLVEHYAPGTFGCHEALHMASFLDGAVNRSLLEHGAILANPEWFELAYRASSALGDLYQAIGAAHLEKPGEDL